MLEELKIIESLSDEAIKGIIRNCKVEKLQIALHNCSNEIINKFLNNFSYDTALSIFESICWTSYTAEEIKNAQLEFYKIMEEMKKTNELEELNENKKINNLGLDFFKLKSVWIEKKIQIENMNTHELLDFIIELEIEARKQGLLCIEDYFPNINDNLIKYGVELVAKQIDTKEFEKLYEEKMKYKLHEIEKRYKLIKEGLLCLLSGESPCNTRLKLSKYF